MNTVTCRSTEISIDKVKLGMRFPEGLYSIVRMTNETLESCRIADLCERLHTEPYPGTGTRPRRYHFQLPGHRLPTLVVETGSVHGACHYATFEFNHQKIYAAPESYGAFIEFMGGFFPGGGYPELLEEGAVYAIEFATDFIGVNVRDVEAFYPLASPGPRIGKRGLPPETIYLDRCGHADFQIYLYDKRLKSQQAVHRYRRDRLRIEARLRLNQSAYRSDHIADLLQRLRNPFRDLVVVERGALQETFCAKRHASFRARIATHGLQAALGANHTVDRRRREAMLRSITAPWWKPEEHWEVCKQRLAEFDVVRWM